MTGGAVSVAVINYQDKPLSAPITPHSHEAKR